MITDVYANVAKFLFVCADLPDEIMRVVEFKGADRISSLYSYEITFTSPNHSIDLESIISSRATLYTSVRNEYYPYSGIITSCKYCGITYDYSVYKVTIQPQLWKLTLTKQNRIFQKSTIPVIITQILDEYELKPYYTLNLESGTYPEHEYIVQYDESDYNFISRLMEENGIWFQFTEEPVLGTVFPGSPGEEAMIIADTPSVFEPLTNTPNLSFKSSEEMVHGDDSIFVDTIHELQITRRTIPQGVLVKNYNYRDPSTSLLSNKEIPEGDIGLYYEYGGRYKKFPEADAYSIIIANRFKCRQRIVRGKSDCKGLRAGCRITVEEHPRDELNQQYLITAVQHTGKFDRTKTGSSAYENYFECIPEDAIEFYHPESSAEKGHMPGVTSAKIEALGSEYATVDEQGRYKIRMHFDRSDTENYAASKYIRQAQLYSGQQYGTHFPSHENAEMIMGHITSDPDKPVSLGTVPNADTISPVTNANKEQSVIKTAGDNLIIMDDTDNKKSMTMKTPYDESFSAGSNQSISVGGDRTVSVKNNESESIKKDSKNTIDGNQTLTVTGDKEETVIKSRSHTVGGNIDETISTDKLIEVVASSEESVTGNRTINVSSDDGLQCTAINTTEVGGECTIEAKEGVGIESKTVTTIKGTSAVTMNGKTIALAGKVTVSVICGGSSMVISPGGIMITAPKITISGKEVTSAAVAANTVMGGAVLVNI